MRFTLSLLVAIVTLFAQEESDSLEHSFVPLSFEIYGGVDHVNSLGTDGLFGASILAELPREVSVFTQVTSEKSLSWLVGSAHRFNSWYILSGGYYLNRYSSYKIDEHNLFIANDVVFHTRPIGVGGAAGWDFRWVKFADESPYFNSFLTWKIALLTTPVERWDLNLELSNSHNRLPVSAGYLEIALTNQIELVDHLSLSFAVGTSVSGFFSAAGYFDRFFTTLGVSYEL